MIWFGVVAIFSYACFGLVFHVISDILEDIKFQKQVKEAKDEAHRNH